MRFLLLLLSLVPAAARADELAKDDLLKFEKQLKSAHANVGPSLACVVASRSDKYPKPAVAAEAWQLGRFDRAAFLKANPNRKDLAERLDLADVESIPDHGFAGGAIIDSAGLVLTNYHSIEGATKIYVHLADGGGSYADIRAADSRCDLAVLKLLDPPSGLKPVRFATVRLAATSEEKATVASGTLGLVMGFSYSAGAALDRPKAGLATLGRIRRPELKGGENASRFASAYNYASMLEFESRFVPAASGAALLNLDGELIGFTTTVATLPAEASRGYAIPMEANFIRTIEVLRRGEEIEYGFLGVQTSQFGGVPGRGGIPVEQHVDPGTPAAAADLRPGDLITNIDGVPVSSFEDLLLHVGHALAGRKVVLTVKRGIQSREAPIVLAKFRNDVPFIASVKPAPVFGLRVDHASVLLQARMLFGAARVFNDIPAGVLAREPLPDSPAAEKFKQLKDNTRWVVTRVDGKAVQTPAEFYKEAAGKKSVKLTVVSANDTFGKEREEREVTLP